MYDTAALAREALVKKYEMGDDALFVQIRELKKIGVDLEAWSKELNHHIVFHIDKER